MQFRNVSLFMEYVQRFGRAVTLTVCRILLLFPLILLLSFSLRAESLIKENPAGLVRIDSMVEVLVDKQNQYDIDDIQRSNISNLFELSNKASLNFGFIKSSYWIKISLDALEEKRLLEVGFPLLDVVELYLPKDSGGYSVKKTGDNFPFDFREIRSGTFVFTLPKSNLAKTYYLHVSSHGGATQIPLRLWSENEFYDHLANKRIWQGLYYGILLVMGVYNLFLFLFIRDKNYFYYTLYISVFSLLQLSLDGVGFEYLWPNKPWVGAYMPTIFSSLSSLCVFIFSRNFLAIKKFSPVLDRVFQVFISICMIILLISLFYDFTAGTKFSTLMGLVLSVVIVVTGIKIFLRGYRPARYFLLAWAGFMIGVSVNALLYYGLIPVTDLTSNAMRIGSVLEVLLFSLAIADRLLILQKENERVEQRQRQYLNDLNLSLESKVQDRTVELSEANEKLEGMNARLKQLALMDGLTDLLNHRAFVDRLVTNLEESYRYQYPISVIMLDLDYFKTVNDSYGHQVGDEVLIAVADVIKSTLRSSDLGGRYGGEEFILMLSHTSIEEAESAAARLHELIGKIDIKGLTGFGVTASLGVACTNPGLEVIDDKELIRRADNALYQAKADGRDRVLLYESNCLEFSAD